MKSIALIGLGNLGWHLLQAFRAVSLPVQTVMTTRTDLAYPEISVVSEPREVGVHDVYFLCVPDGAIGDVAQQLQAPAGSVVVHCSGSSALDVMGPIIAQKAVFYPLYSFRKERQVDFQHIPIFIHATSPETVAQLCAMANRITDTVVEIDDGQRRWLHLAAVLVNNFVNELYSSAAELMAEHQMEFSWLLPMISGTAANLERHSPQALQTGPARRGDGETIGRHLAMLSSNPELRGIYEMLSNRIAHRKDDENLTG